MIITGCSQLIPGSQMEVEEEISVPVGRSKTHTNGN